MNKYRVLALGKEETRYRIADPAEPSEIVDITCETDLVEAVTRLKQEKFGVSLVDACTPDLVTTCYRINSLDADPLASIRGTSPKKLGKQSFIDVDDSYIPADSDMNELFSRMHAIQHNCKSGFKKLKTSLDVLLVTNDPDVKVSVGLAFRSFWPESRVYCAPSIVNGILTLRKVDVDLTIMDLGKAEKSDFRTLRRICSFCKSPVLVMAPNFKEETVMEAGKCGADDLIVKPFKPAVFIAHIRQNVNRPEYAS